MSEIEYSTGPEPRTVRAPNGKVLKAPDDWELLPPGDAALTRRVKLAGDHWVVRERRGRRSFSRGVWAPSATIARIRLELEAERAAPSHAKRREADAQRRVKVQAAYVGEFEQAVMDYLDFHERHQTLAANLAKAVAAHATPVGSGTVARTTRIPIEERAEAAVIAWMRHQATAYDSMSIPRKRGARREVRGMLARSSKQLLDTYRRGESKGPDCPLWMALERRDPSPQ